MLMFKIGGEEAVGNGEGGRERSGFKGRRGFVVKSIMTITIDSK